MARLLLLLFLVACAKPAEPTAAEVLAAVQEQLRDTPAWTGKLRLDSDELVLEVGLRVTPGKVRYESVRRGAGGGGMTYESDRGELRRQVARLVTGGVRALAEVGARREHRFAAVKRLPGDQLELAFDTLVDGAVVGGGVLTVDGKRHLPLHRETRLRAGDGGAEKLERESYDIVIEASSKP